MPDRTEHVYDPEDPVEEFTPLLFVDENVDDLVDDVDGDDAA